MHRSPRIFIQSIIPKVSRVRKAKFSAQALPTPKIFCEHAMLIFSAYAEATASCRRPGGSGRIRGREREGDMAQFAENVLGASFKVSTLAKEKLSPTLNMRKISG